MNVPSLVGTLSLAVVGYELLRPTSARDLTRSHHRKNDGKTARDCPQGGCRSEMRQIQLDTAMNTLHRDDRLGGTTLRGARQYVTSQYLREAHEHPGVALVAPSIS